MADLKSLRKALVDGLRAAFSAVRKAHPEETFYAYALFTEPLLGYVLPSCNTEEQLAGADPETRWSPPDWAYHGEGEEHLERAGALLEAIHEGLDEDDDEARQPLWRTFHDALRDLDREGLFGRGPERDRVVVNVLWGDQDLVTHLQSAEELNPPAAFLRYALDEAGGLVQWIEELEGQRSKSARAARAQAVAMLERVQALAVRREACCPACGEHPLRGPAWVCDGCLVTFDTFETRAKCPRCPKSWRDTQCNACGAWSPHARWWSNA